MDSSFSGFTADLRGRLVDRPNRFVVRVDTDQGRLEAHCPNPGRMTELLFPGGEVTLERAGGPRKLGYTLVAIRHPVTGDTVPLVSVRANHAVAALVLPRLFPSGVVRSEFPLEASRFDFLVEEAGQRHLVEVKACSEVEYGSALFPDAPSQRARKHLEELAAWADRGFVPHVIFAVVHGRPSWLGPNVHTDPGFAETLRALAPRLNLHAAVLRTSATGATAFEGFLPVRLPPPLADAGLLVRLVPGDEWEVVVEDHGASWSRRLAQAPARSSFGLRVDPRHRDQLARELAPLRRPDDPRLDPGFIQTILRWRHQAWRAD